jgi:hypothetical protein
VPWVELFLFELQTATFGLRKLRVTPIAASIVLQNSTERASQDHGCLFTVVLEYMHLRKPKWPGVALFYELTAQLLRSVLYTRSITLWASRAPFCPPVQAKSQFRGKMKAHLNFVNCFGRCKIIYTNSENIDMGHNELERLHPYWTWKSSQVDDMAHVNMCFGAC